MAEDKSLDIQKVIDQSARRTTLQDLAQKGFDNVKVLDEKAIQDLIRQAVERAITTLSAEEKARVLAESRKELDRLMHEHKAMRSRAQLLEADKNELIEQVEALQREVQLQKELEEEELHKKLQEGMGSLQGQVEEALKLRRSAEEELAGLRKEAEQRRQEEARLREDLGRAGQEIERLQQQLESEREKGREIPALQARLEELKRQHETTQETLRKRHAEGEQREQDLARLRRETEGELAALKKTLAEGHASETGLRAQLEELQARHRSAKEESEMLRAEASRGRSALEESRRELAALVARQEQTIVVTSELQEIERRREAEQQELEKLRQGFVQAQGEHERAQKDLTQAQALLAREQETARAAGIESATLQGRLVELQNRLAAVDREFQDLRLENARLQERSRMMESTAASAPLEKVAKLLEMAIRRGALAPIPAAAPSYAAPRPRKTAKGKAAAPAPAAGIAYDGREVLQGFFRKIGLKELFRKHVPIRERRGEEHPSETLLEVVHALIAGDGSGGKAKRMEIIGAPKGPDAARLRRFLEGLSPRAIRGISGVHGGLRLHLFGPPKTQEVLTWDVFAPQVGRARAKVRPLVCFDSAAGEFRSARLRNPGSAEIAPFLKDCLSQAPSSFAKDHLVLRIGAEFFGESVVRLLEAKGCSYVVEAPDSREVRKAARGCAFRKIGGGWEAGAFELRLHPIRKTTGRFAVLRRRAGKKGRLERAPLFRDGKVVYHVYAVDRTMSAARAHEIYGGRAAAEQDVRTRLEELPGHRLMGRRPGAFFQTYLLSSDLIQWFKKVALSPAERSLNLERLRSEVLMLSAGAGRKIRILSRKGRHRRLFESMAGKVRAFRPAAPFRFRV